MFVLMEQAEAAWGCTSSCTHPEMQMHTEEQCPFHIWPVKDCTLIMHIQRMQNCTHVCKDISKGVIFIGLLKTLSRHWHQSLSAIIPRKTHKMWTKKHVFATTKSRGDELRSSWRSRDTIAARQCLWFTQCVCVWYLRRDITCLVSRRSLGQSGSITHWRCKPFSALSQGVTKRLPFIVMAAITQTPSIRLNRVT